MKENECVYNDKFYEHESQTASQSAHYIISSLLEELRFNPTSVIDIGCGLGDFLAEFMKLGVNDTLGIEGEYLAIDKIKVPREHILLHDLREKLIINRRFDLAVCLEVAEHIDEKNSDNLIETLTSASSVILFSAATPGQGGDQHVNEQWPQYWQDKFIKYNYLLIDNLRAKIWDNNEIAWWYRQNIMIACKIDKITSLIKKDKTSFILPVSHPISIEYKHNQAMNSIQDLEERLRASRSDNNQAMNNIQDLKDQLSQYEHSKSWLITKPLRNIVKNTKNIYETIFMGKTKTTILLKAYRNLPLSIKNKRKISHFAIKFFPNTSKKVMTARSTINAEMVSMISQYPPKGKPSSKKVLVVEHRIPTPDKTSSSVRLLALLELLKEENAEVTLLSDTGLNGYHWVLADVEKEINRYTDVLDNMSIKYYIGRENCINHLNTNGFEYSHAILCYPEICFFYAPIISYLSPMARIIYDTVDIHYLRFEREAEIRNDKSVLEKSEWYKKIETSNLRCVDMAIAITKNEEDICKQISPNLPVIIIPNIHKTEADIENLKPRIERHGLLFIGHYLHTPNEDAAIYLCKEILPIINKLIGLEPDVFLIGSSITDNVKKLSNNQIQTIGYVEDPSEYFNKARVFVAPLRFGAGMKGKIGQALSYCLPIVTTSIGAEGMNLTNGENVMISDNSLGFAEAVVRVYEDDILWQNLSNKGMMHIQKNFSKEAARSSVRSLLEHQN